jgi:hypothetical protein
MELFTILIGLAEVGLMIWQVRIMQAATTTVPPSGTERREKKLSYWPVALMGVLAIAVWIPYFLRVGEPKRVNAMLMWSTLTDGCLTGIDGAQLLEYSDKYNLGVACGISNVTTDANQDTAIAVSTPFTIVKDQMLIESKFPPALLDTMKTLAALSPPQAANIWHKIFILPKKVDMSRIRKVADIRELGGKMVNNCEPIE